MQIRQDREQKRPKELAIHQRQFKVNQRVIRFKLLRHENVATILQDKRPNAD